MQDRRIKKSKEALKKALIDLMKKKDLSKISVKEICESADVNRSTFYSNYNDIYELIREVHSDMFNMITQSVKSRWCDLRTNDTEEMYNEILEIVKMLKENKEIYLLFLSNNKENLFETNMFFYHVNKFKINLEQSGLEYSFVYHAVGAFAMICTWLERGCKEPCEEVAQILWRASASYRNSESY